MKTFLAFGAGSRICAALPALPRRRPARRALPARSAVHWRPHGAMSHPLGGFTGVAAPAPGPVAGTADRRGPGLTRTDTRITSPVILNLTRLFRSYSGLWGWLRLQRRPPAAPA